MRSLVTRTPDLRSLSAQETSVSGQCARTKRAPDTVPHHANAAPRPALTPPTNTLLDLPPLASRLTSRQLPPRAEINLHSNLPANPETA